MKVERSCRVRVKTLLGDAVRLDLEVGDMVSASWRGPGQFVHIKCGHSRLLRRPISVCTCQRGAPDTLSIVFEVRGSGTEWLARREAGDKLDVLGLLGNGFPVRKEGRYLLAGGGIGVPPLLGCALETSGSTAVLGFRSQDKCLLAEEFQAVCAKVLLATDDGSLGYHGFVDALVRQELEQDRAYTAVLACGPKPMLKAVAAVAAQFQVPCQVSLEERMGCGVGACLVCACKKSDGSMGHVCKDGPVFDAGEVDWNDES